MFYVISDQFGILRMCFQIWAKTCYTFAINSAVVSSLPPFFLRGLLCSCSPSFSDNDLTLIESISTSCSSTWSPSFMLVSGVVSLGVGFFYAQTGTAITKYLTIYKTYKNNIKQRCTWEWCEYSHYLTLISGGVTINDLLNSTTLLAFKVLHRSPQSVWTVILKLRIAHLC